MQIYGRSSQIIVDAQALILSLQYVIDFVCCLNPSSHLFAYYLRLGYLIPKQVLLLNPLEYPSYCNNDRGSMAYIGSCSES